MDTRKFIRKLYDISDDMEVLEKSIAYAYLNSNSIDYSGFEFFKDLFSAFDQFIAAEVTTLFKKDCPSSSIENLVEIFEYLVPEAQRKSHGVVYTPEKIKNHIVESVINKEAIPKVCDPSCGCGSFLITAARWMHHRYNISYQELFSEYIYGVDIDPMAIRKAIILFNILACLDREALSCKFENLICADALDRTVIDSLYRRVGNGFNCIIGNPPYVRSRNMMNSIKSNLVYWDTAKNGNVDLYIPFYEVGLTLLNPKGVLGYISPNTFIQSVNGRSLRRYFKDKKFDTTIFDFRETQVFKGVTSYTCIVLVDKKKKTSLLHYALLNGKCSLIDYSFTDYSFEHFDDGAPWRMCNEQVDNVLRRIETIGKPLGDYKIRNGLATLKNDIYFFKPIRETNDFYIREYKGYEYKIEKKICIDVIKPNILKSEEDLLSKAEKAIFPYVKLNSQYVIIPESDLSKQYPNTYQFLLEMRDVLGKRDKGKGNYPAWYAYGRTQGVFNQGKKLLLPYISDMPKAVISTDENLLFYCGYAVFAEDEQELKLLKRFLESSVFWYYIIHTSKPYSKGYMALAKNYIKNFSIPKLSNEQVAYILSQPDDKEFDNWIWKLYGVMTPTKLDEMQSIQSK
ncbi:MAG: class I SAM-dependent DNA methyltransferase [Acidaminococcaceae bacterium]